MQLYALFRLFQSLKHSRSSPHCKARHRADKLIEEKLQEKGIEMIVDGLSFDAMADLIKEHEITCPECGSANFTEIRQFNLMFKTHQGVTKTSTNEIYLRPETDCCFVSV